MSDAVAGGAGLVIFSGDKLLGGPQAGCLVGASQLIARCRNNPIARAVRADKLTLAGLAATLALYQDEEDALASIPVLTMLTLSSGDLAARAARLASLCPPGAARHYPGGRVCGRRRGIPRRGAADHAGGADCRRNGSGRVGSPSAAGSAFRRGTRVGRSRPARSPDPS